MTNDQVDPARLTGEALRRWYRRSPEEIERETLAARRFTGFFGVSSEADPGRERVLGSAFTRLAGQRNSRFAFGNGHETLASQTSRGVDPSSTSPGRWRQGGGPNLPHLIDIRATRPEPPTQAGSASTDRWSAQLPPRSSATTPGAPVGFNASGSRPSARAMAAQGARPTQGGVASGKRASQAPAAFLGPQGRNSTVSAKGPPRPDPPRADVFQRGPDGKLRPVPGWRTTGPFDFDVWSRNIDWPGVGSDLTNIALGALTSMEGGAFVGRIIDGLGYKIGPDVVRGIIHGHHSWPKFMGGPGEQDLARVYESLHRMFHDELAAALKQAGFPRIGGRGGSTEDWADFFAKNAGKRDEAVAILQRATRDFDRKNGTKISKYLDDTLTKGQASGSIPPQ